MRAGAAHRLYDAGGLAGGIVYGALHALAQGANHCLGLLSRLVYVALQISSCSVYLGIRPAGCVLCKARAPVRVLSVGAFYTISVRCSHIAETWKHLRTAAFRGYAAGTQQLSGQKQYGCLNEGPREMCLPALRLAATAVSEPPLVVVSCTVSPAPDL